MLLFAATLYQFQSTRPVKGATWAWRGMDWVMVFQSTRPVKGATWNGEAWNGEALVSIHAPREGRDRCGASSPTASGTFQSTRPVKGATHDGSTMQIDVAVSIHAPREGRDSRGTWCCCRRCRFNPRAP